MDPMLEIFLVGTVGAAAPEILRLWTIARNRQTFTWSWFYLVISIIFACLGGFIALILPSDNVRAAFYAGLSTPVIINTALKKVGGEQNRKNVTKAIAEERALSRYDFFVEGL